MKYQNIIKGKFIERTNRFVAVLDINGRVEKAHVKNTGRCRELLIPGASVYLEDHGADMGNRKLRYSLIAVEKNAERGRLLVNMDSQAPNKVVREALQGGTLAIPGFGAVACVKGEQRYGASRIDFYAEDSDGHRLLLEVKGVTLEDDGIARFPDAPTERGVRHIEELVAARRQGYLSCILFVIQMKGIRLFSPNDDTHPQFGEALRRAQAAGVAVLAYDCIVKRDALCIDIPVPVKL